MKNLNKILVLGDIHGRDCWKDIIERENPDNVIFLGDYVSSHEGISIEDQIENLKEILDYKEANPDMVTLLRGNHDMEALGYYWAECYPNFGSTWLMQNKDRFLKDTQWLVEDDDVVFSHAGISQRWYDDMVAKYNITSISDINNIEPNEMFGFSPCKMSDYTGTSATQPLTWIRPVGLIEYGIQDKIHVVGHSTIRHIVELYDELHKNDPENADMCKCHVWLCDCLPDEYLIIDNGKFIPKSLKF